jgi:prepilin peptidase CpaA
MTANDPTLLQAALTTTLLVVLALAVWQDLARHRIPNVLTITGFAAALALRALEGGMPGIVSALAGAGVGLVCFLPLYFAKGMGAGDVKLMAAAGAFLGPVAAFLAALVSLTAGAVLALVVVVWRRAEMRSQAAGVAPTAPLRKERFPYAAAIAAGVLSTLWLSGMLEVPVP